MVGSSPRLDKNELDLRPIILKKDAILDDIFSDENINSIKTFFKNDRIKYILISIASNDSNGNYIKSRENSLDFLLIFINPAPRERLERLIIL